MANRSIDGVDVNIASSEQLSSYSVANAHLNRFKVPQLYDSSDPNACVFVALFNGTGNDAIKNPENITNVGLLKIQIEDIARTNPNVAGFYKEGPGTQGGLVGTVDGAIGGSYTDRIETMYEKFALQTSRWLEQNPDAKISVIAIGFSPNDSPTIPTQEKDKM